MGRIPLVDRATATPEQQAVWDRIAAGPRKDVRGPFLVALHSPELADRLQHLGAFLRYGTSLEPQLTEWAILVVARHWQCAHEWSSHQPIALTAGVPAAAVAALQAGERPHLEEPRMKVVFDYSTEMLERHRASGPTHERALALLGATGLVELIGILGYYSGLAMMLNAQEVSTDTPEQAALPG